MLSGTFPYRAINTKYWQFVGVLSVSVSVIYIWLYIVTQSGRASLLNASQCVSRKSRGNLSQHLVEPQSKQKPAHKVSVQSSQVVNNDRERESERQGR